MGTLNWILDRVIEDIDKLKRIFQISEKVLVYITLKVMKSVFPSPKQEADLRTDDTK